tara:strand:- start:49371 stop:49856 length:486 start_codon:yes stop_codon:yes gene_type:complete
MSRGVSRRRYMQNTFGCCTFFPHARMTLTAPNSVMARIPKEGLPDLLFRRRKSLGLHKHEVAETLKVHREVVGLWERGEHQPRVKYIPALIDFLQDDSWLPGGSFDARLYRFRAQRGWTQEQLARWLGKDERSIRQWEDGRFPENVELIRIDGRLAAGTVR